MGFLDPFKPYFLSFFGMGFVQFLFCVFFFVYDHETHVCWQDFSFWTNRQFLRDNLLEAYMWNHSCVQSFVFRKERFVLFLFIILRTDFPVPLGSPLLGTTVEIRDANGSVVLEGEGQIFIGYFIFFFNSSKIFFLVDF